MGDYTEPRTCSKSEYPVSSDSEETLRLTLTSPSCRYVVFTSGLANITLPYYPDIAVVHGGSKGIIFAADTTGDGHVTTYPGDKPTIALQIPVEGGVPPNHTVLYSGPCKARDIKVIGT